MTVASRVAVMDHGKLIQIATPDAIYETPNSTYVADFIGDVNIIRSTSTPTETGITLAWADAQTDLTAKTEHSFNKGDTAYLAIRPEKIAITADEPKGRDNAVQGKVLDIAYLGNISTYHVELPGGQIIKAQTANTDRISRRDFTWEQPVWLSWTDTAGVVLSR